MNSALPNRDRHTNDTDQRNGRQSLVQAVIGLLVLIAGLGIAWSMLGSSRDVGRQQAAPERAARLVQIHEASLESQAVSVTAWGEVKPSRSLTVSPRVAGQVQSLGPGFEPGSMVAAGDMLVQLDKQDYALAVERARSALTQARADLAIEEGQQSVARREYELLGEKVSDAERGLILRKPQLDSAQAAVRSAEADLADARLAVERTRITAPFDAIVLSRDVAPGAEVSSSTALAELVGLHTWWVELSVPVTALKWIRFPADGKAGSTVALRYEGVWPEGTTREGRVVRLLGDLEEGGRMARVLVRIDDPMARDSRNPDTPRLLVGAFIRGNIQGRQVENAVVLKPEWLHAGNTVWLMDDKGQLKMQTVAIAYRDADRVLVDQGIAPGDRIVTSQMSVAAAGMPLRVQQENTSGSDDDGA